MTEEDYLALTEAQLQEALARRKKDRKVDEKEAHEAKEFARWENQMKRGCCG